MIYYGISARPAPNSGSVPVKGGVSQLRGETEKKFKRCAEVSLFLISYASAQPERLLPAANRLVGKFPPTCGYSEIN